jgi:hypothetical protein
MAEPTTPAPEPPGASQAQEERRASERFPPGVAVSWHVLREDRDEEPRASVHNLSATGVGLLVDRPFKPGTVLVLGLQTRHRRLSRPLPARVMHASTAEGGKWLVGCQFVRKLSEAELQVLLDGA